MAYPLKTGKNFIPNKNRFNFETSSGSKVNIFLLSDSFEYDIELIKSVPPPRNTYSHILIPNKVDCNINGTPFHYMENTNKMLKKESIVKNDNKIIPKLTFVDHKNNLNTKLTAKNIYIPISDVLIKAQPIIRKMKSEDMRKMIFDIFDKLMKFEGVPDVNLNVLLIDTNRFNLYKEYNNDGLFKSDIINSLMMAYMNNPINRIKKLNWMIIFRTKECDYKFNTSKFTTEEVELMKDMMFKIGKESYVNDSELNDSYGDSIDSFESNDNEVAGSDIEDIQKLYTNNDNPQTIIKGKSINNIKNSIDAIKNKLGENVLNSNMNDNGDDESDNRDSLYKAKSFNINTELLSRIHGIRTNKDLLNNYNKISNELSSDTNPNNQVESRIMNDASKRLAKIAQPINDVNSLNTVTSPRELKMKSINAQIKLKNISLNTVDSVIDMPVPDPIVPNGVTTTNDGVAKGSKFASVTKAYEENMLEQDLVSAFMQLGNLPDGYTVENIEVTDVSTVLTLMDNWKVSLKSKSNGSKSVINVRIPKVYNSRFLNNGTWYTIQKQDFPIPIMKINKREVMLTSNMNKITVSRFDTRSLLHVGMFVKTLSKALNEDGSNKYITIGSSVSVNSQFMSTIEFDEYAKKYVSFINPESECEIYFNRKTCLEKFGFVTVSEDEFCCGMINKVPVVLNTETGLTRQNTTLTETMLSTLPVEIQNEYHKIKPGKLSMHAECRVNGMNIPLGVCIAGWEGFSSLLKKSGCKYQFVDKSFSDPKYLLLRFKDKTIAIEDTLTNQLLFNGFYRINTKAYTIDEFDSTLFDMDSVWIDIFNQLFFKLYSNLTPFLTTYHFFVDSITKEVCNHYNIPDNLIDMLIYSAKLLADNSYSNENHSSFYRIRSTEIIPAILHRLLAFAISANVHRMGSGSKGNSTLQFNPNSLMKELMELQTVKTMSALNPYTDLHSMEVISRKGVMGLNNDKSYSLNKRSFDPSNIGKYGISSSNDNNVGINRQLCVDPKIDSVRGYTSLTDARDTQFTDLQLASFTDLLTPGTISRDDSIRTTIADSQTGHQVAVDDAEPVIVSNGMDEIAAAYTSDQFSVLAEDDGDVIDNEDGFMIIKYKNGKQKAINIGDRFAANSSSGFYVNNKLESNFQKGDSFKKNDILAYHPKFFNKDAFGHIRMNIGPMLKVAFMGTYATYEDAGIITANASKRLMTKLTMKQTIKLDATDNVEKVVQVGDEIEIGDPLIVFGLGDTGDKAVDNFLKAFQTDSSPTSMLDNAKRIIKSDHAGTVVDVKMYTTKSMDRLSPSLFEIFDTYFKNNIRKRKILDKYDKSKSVYKLGTLYDEPTEPLSGQTIKGQTCDIMIEIYIEHDDEMSVGDKAVAFGAMKQIVSETIEPGLEPYSQNRPEEEVSMFVSSASILKRMVPSLILTASANKCHIELKRQIREIWES